LVRKFKTVDYEAMLKQTVSIEECLPPNHLARFVVQMIAQLDLSSIYGAYGAKGGIAIAPEILLGMLIYGYATGVFSSRELEKASYESIPFRFIAGNLQPDHDTIANFRSRFLEQIKELFVQILEMAVGSDVLKVEDISIDGTKIHADASKSKAVSHKRLEEIQLQLRAEVEELMKYGQKADEIKVGEKVDVVGEIARREERLSNLEKAKQELHNRAQEQYELDRAKYTEKMSERAAYTEKTGKKPSGRVPSPPFLPSRITLNTISLILNHES
jgi:transposase